MVSDTLKTAAIESNCRTISDYRKFAVANITDILKLAQKQADKTGVNVFEMIQHFNVLTDRNGKPEHSQSEIKRVIKAAVLNDNDFNSIESTSILNALAWYALEETFKQENK